MMPYQPEANDYCVKVEKSAPAVFTFHMWQYIDGEWHYLYEAPQVITLDKLKEHSNIYSTDGYDYRRGRKSTL